VSVCVFAKESKVLNNSGIRRSSGSPPLFRWWNMGDNGTKELDNGLDEEDQWQLYASAEYGSDYDASEESDAPELDEEEVWFDGDDFEVDRGTLDWDAPPCPAPLGITHVIKLGVCDYCLNRISGRISDKRGADAGSELRDEGFQRDSDLPSKISQDICPLCENLFDDVENIVNRVIDSLTGIAFSTLQFGIHLPKDLIQEEDRVRTKFGAQGSLPLKGALVRSIHERIMESDMDVVFVKERPDVMILVDGLTLRVDVDVRPVFLYGRYRKFARGIPQTRWPCRACRGRSNGCDSCDGTGLQYPDSVQDLIGEPIRSALNASDTSFHGMGREDIDVRCMGSGRPFVLEVKRPSIRDYQLDELVRLVNENGSGRVEVDELSWCNRSRINEVKSSRSDKSYNIRFRTSETIDSQLVSKSILSLSDTEINQETPKRVSHRRADKIRKRRVVSVDSVSVEGDEVEVTLRCEAGTYVKELVHSDEGRTVPSISSVIGTECEVIWLDVEDIHYELALS